MIRPQAYSNEFVTFRPLPYLDVDGLANGGVLAKGQVVWVDRAQLVGPSPVRAYVDEVGIVTVDPRSLVSGDLFRERAISQDV